MTKGALKIRKINKLSEKYETASAEEREKILEELKAIENNHKTPLMPKCLAREIIDSKMKQKIKLLSEELKLPAPDTKKEKSDDLDSLINELNGASSFCSQYLNAGKWITSLDAFKSDPEVIRMDHELDRYMNTIRTLGDNHYEYAVDSLIKTALDAPVPYIYHTVCVALGKIGNSKAIRWLLELHDRPISEFLDGRNECAILGSVIGLCIVYERNPDNNVLKEIITTIKEYKKVNISHLLCIKDPTEEMQLQKEALRSVFPDVFFR